MYNMNNQAQIDIEPSFGGTPRMNPELRELDLFFPDLALLPPVSILSIEHRNDAIAQIKTARTHYQQGLMRYLRQNEVPASLRAMQLAVDTVLICMPQDQSRTFWWLACGLLDCVQLGGLPAELDARKLFARIDRQMYAVAEGNVGDVQAVMNEMLYLIGRSRNVSERVGQIKQHYALERYLADHSRLSQAELAQVLDIMHEQFRLAEENWEECARGDAAAYMNFIKAAESLALYSERLQPRTLQQLTRQIQAVSLQVSAPEYVQLIAMDMAMALLLLGNGIEHYRHLSDSFHEQVNILSARMQATLNKQPENAAQLAELISLHCQMQHDAAMVPLAKAMLTNLQHVKYGLSVFFNDSSHRDELNGLPRQLAQIRGGLRFLSLELAEQLLVSIQDSVRFFEQAKAVPLPAENLTLAGSVSTLENYLDHLIHAQKYDVAALRTSLDDLSKLHQAGAGTSVVVTDNPEIAEMSPRLQAEDQELLEVFLEEAQEALGFMRDNLDICQSHPDNTEPLGNIRRGFHTLKGSGRMVGLTDLGEVAWAIERALNKWLRDNKTATPELLDFINLAVQKFSAWIEVLNSNGSVKIEADDLIAMALKVEHGSDAEVLVPSVATTVQQDDELAVFIEPEQVVIGDIRLNSTLFNISSEEAKQNALALHEQFAAMCATEPLIVQYDFMRAAHTLAGVCRNIGLDDVANLSLALESWLQARMEKSFTLSNAQSQMLQQAIAALQEMVQNICDHEMPLARKELVDQLHADKDKLREEAVSPQTFSLPVAPVQTVVSDEINKSEVAVRVEKLQVRDDVDEQLLTIFLAEADELSPKIGAGLRVWHASPHDTTQPDLLKRWLHTFKGSARMAGAMRIGQIAHEMEDRVLAAKKMRDQDGYWDSLESDLDRITALLEELRSGKIKATEVAGTELGRRAEDQSGKELRSERRALEVGAERALLANMLRVRSDVVDRLVNEAGEISVARSRMETEMGDFKEGLLELTNSVTRLRNQLREIEIQAESQMQARVLLLKDDTEHFDPLEFDRFTRLQELTRFMNESVHDVQTVQQSLLKNIDETAAAISAQARLNRELQQGLMNVRMVPFSSISERLYRIVRQTGKELDKRANLELSGTAVELDRSVLEKMAAPFEHLLRNAIVHGLESEQLRIQSGKDPIGDIQLNLRQESNEVVFEFSDDGAGLKFSALRETAIAKGFLQAGEAVSDEQLTQLIFTSGISTASEVTEVAGRGIGMDVVRSEISALGGRIDVSSKTGSGAHFIIYLPLTLAVTQTLMVRSGDTLYAIPSAMVEQVRQVKSAEMSAMYGERETIWQGKTYPLHYLPHLLGDINHAAENQPRNPILLLRSGEQRIALHVDELAGNQESVVKNIGPQLARLSGIAGATVQGNGAVVLILNPVQLAQRIAASIMALANTVPKMRRTQPMIMVVDDSLTVRKITTRLLLRAGYHVATARDGVDALEQIAEIIPDVILLDIEMPRMDGFELTKHLRQDARTRHVPIIIITSRTAEKHRNYASELGVSAYLGKPYQEAELLQHITKAAKNWNSLEATCEVNA
jgi:chemosensory pili system protein ChpA (sensor histidine kinase/response regulator)